jgi:hypothetical protein
MTTTKDSSGADMKSVKVTVQIDPAIAADIRCYARFRHVAANNLIRDAVQHVMYFAEHRMKYVVNRDANPVTACQNAPVKSTRIVVKIDEVVVANVRRYARRRHVTANSVISAAVQHVMYFAEERLQVVTARDLPFQIRQSRSTTNTVLRTG